MVAGWGCKKIDSAGGSLHCVPFAAAACMKQAAVRVLALPYPNSFGVGFHRPYLTRQIKAGANAFIADAL